MIIVHDGRHTADMENTARSVLRTVLRTDDHVFVENDFILLILRNIESEALASAEAVINAGLHAAHPELYSKIAFKSAQHVQKEKR